MQTIVSTIWPEVPVAGTELVCASTETESAKPTNNAANIFFMRFNFYGILLQFTNLIPHKAAILIGQSVSASRIRESIPVCGDIR
jgi:hypothetical protein